MQDEGRGQRKRSYLPATCGKPQKGCKGGQDWTRAYGGPGRCDGKGWGWSEASDERAEEAAVNGSEAERDKVTPDCEEPMLASGLEAKPAKKRKVSKSKSKGKKKKKSTSTAKKKTVDIETRIVSSYAENPALEFMKILETAYLNSKKAGPDLEQKINAARKRHI